MSKGPSSTQKDSSTQQVQLPQWMSDAGQSLFNKATADSAASPVVKYTGEIAPGLNATQNAAIAQAGSTAKTGQSQIAAGQSAISGSLGKGDRVTAGSFTPAAAAQYESPYLKDVQQRTVGDILRDGTIQLQGVGDAAGADHAYGGTRQGVAQAEATKGINQNILDYLASSNQAGYENAQQQFNTDADRSLTAGTTNAGLTQQEKDRGVAAGAALGNLGQQASGVNAESINNQVKVGTMAQQSQAAQDAANYNEALRVQDGTVNRDEDLMAILAGTPRNVTTTGSGTSTQTSNPGWLNTALSVGGMAASIYSDARLKRDITHVETLEDGLPIVDFNYRDGMGLPEGRFRGVLAQDVARFRPRALGPVRNGYATVNYNALEG